MVQTAKILSFIPLYKIFYGLTFKELTYYFLSYITKCSRIQMAFTFALFCLHEFSNITQIMKVVLQYTLNL